MNKYLSYLAMVALIIFSGGLAIAGYGMIWADDWPFWMKVFWSLYFPWAILLLVYIGTKD